MIDPDELTTELRAIPRVGPKLASQIVETVIRHIGEPQAPAGGFAIEASFETRAGDVVASNPTSIQWASEEEFNKVSIYRTPCPAHLDILRRVQNGPQGCGLCGVVGCNDRCDIWKALTPVA